MPTHSPSHVAARPGRVPDETDYAQRDFINLVSAATLLVIAILIVLTVRAVEESEKQQRCFESGRRDCVVIAAPPRGMRVPAY